MDAPFQYNPYNPNIRLITREDVKRILYAHGLPPIVHDFTLYQRAFVHESYTHKTHNKDGVPIHYAPRPDDCPPLRSKSYERLEFIGDGVLECATKLYLYRRFPLAREGFMTITKISLVQNEHIGKIAIAMGLHKWVVVSAQLDAETRVNHRAMGNIFEAFLGAIYKDFETVSASTDIRALLSPPAYGVVYEDDEDEGDKEDEEGTDISDEEMESEGEEAAVDDGEAEGDSVYVHEGTWCNGACGALAQHECMTDACVPLPFYQHSSLSASTGLGFFFASRFLEAVIENPRYVNWHDILHRESNHKTALQELVQRRFHVVPCYHILSAPDDRDKQSSYVMGVCLCIGYNPHKVAPEALVCDRMYTFDDIDALLARTHGRAYVLLAQAHSRNKKKAEQLACKTYMDFLRTATKTIT